MTDLDTAALDGIAARWSRDGGMGNDRSAEDYTDAGCRILAEHAFRDVPALVAEVRRLRDDVARHGDCFCDYTTGPEETCPQHGRTYAEWVERGDVLADRQARVREVLDHWDEHARDRILAALDGPAAAGGERA